MNFQELNGKSIREAFREFHRDNPAIFKAFEEQALKAINKGRTKISAKMIINWIRWNCFIETNDKYFSINDAYGSYYARLFASVYPDHAEKFEFRKLRNEEPGPYMIDEDGQLKFL